MHLTVISYCETLDLVFEHVALIANPLVAPEKHAFVRCQRPAQLYNAVASIGRPVRLLDLYGHGAPGKLRLGDKELLDVRPRTWKVVAELEPLLAPDARIRLLGCNSAVGEGGFRLLHGLSAALSGRLVLGMTADIWYQDFGPSGIRRQVAARWLVSSKALRAPIAQRRRSDPC